jgi:hypothetical protein
MEMAFRSQEAAVRVAVLAIALVPLAGAESVLSLKVTHDHLRGRQAGTLLITQEGLSYREDPTAKQQKNGGQPHAFDWSFGEIQQLQLSPQKVRILTYKDNRWRLGMDREYELDVIPGEPVRQVYESLRKRLDQRFVAALADRSNQSLWELRVKHLKPFGGSHGVLSVGSGQIVYAADGKEESRSWRFSDIENISTSGPFQLSIVTYERALTDYGNLKQFNFQLKERLDEARYNELWRRLNESKGLQILLTSKEKKRGEENADNSGGVRSAADGGGQDVDLQWRNH